MPYIDVSPLLDFGAHSLERRALGVGGGPTSTANIQHLPSEPVAAAGQTASSMPDSDNGSDTRGLTKTILEWAFAIAALLIVASLSVWKYNRLKRSRARLNTNGPTHYIHARGFTLQNSRGEGGNYPLTHTDSLNPGLPDGDPTNANAPRRSRRAARGADIDEGGRRGGGGVDVDGDDELPAYEPKGGPPGYADGVPPGAAGVSGEHVGRGDGDWEMVELREVRNRVEAPPPGIDEVFAVEGERAQTRTPSALNARADTTANGAGADDNDRQADEATEGTSSDSGAPQRHPAAANGEVVEERDITDAHVYSTSPNNPQPQVAPAETHSSTIPASSDTNTNVTHPHPHTQTQPTGQTQMEDTPGIPGS